MLLNILLFAGLLGTATALWTASFRPPKQPWRLSARPIDPLDFSKNTPPRALPRTTRSTNSGKSLGKDDSEYIDRVVRADKSFTNLNLTAVEELIVGEEAELLQSLPLNALASFRPVLSALVPRLSFIMLLVHIILLLPALRFLKIELDVSIVPFLYIAPMLLTVPFVSSFLWESDIYESPVITRGMELFLCAEKQRAVSKLASETTRLLQIVVSEGSCASTKDPGERSPLIQLAYLRLISRIDPEALCKESMAFKAKRAGKATALTSSSGNAAGSGTAWLRSSKAAQGGVTLIDAVKALVDEAASLNAEKNAAGRGRPGGSESERDSEVLQQLKDLQYQLDRSSKKKKDSSGQIDP